MEKQNAKSLMPTIAVIGGGASGLLVVHQLFNEFKRLNQKNFKVLWFGKEKVFGLGAAYSTKNKEHLLNVRTEGMSAFPDDPLHFWNWASKLQKIEKTSFLPRTLYGEYLQELIPHDLHLEQINEEVMEIHPIPIANKPGNKFECITINKVYLADYVVLAVGHLFPKKKPAEPNEISDISKIAEGSKVLFIGTGLTMVDGVLTLLSRDNPGKLTAISRRGLLPRVHSFYQKHSPTLKFEEWLKGENYSLRSSFKMMVEECQNAMLNGSDWRSVFDLIRPKVPKIWSHFSTKDRKRFLRHVVRYWDIHRHRMAPDVFQQLENAKNSGTFQVIKGSLDQISKSDFDAIVDCRGLSMDIRACDSPLIQQLIQIKILKLDDPSLGAQVGSEEIKNIDLVGPILRGRDWESIAIPELRVQAKEAAVRVANWFSPP